MGNMDWVSRRAFHGVSLTHNGFITLYLEDHRHLHLHVLSSDLCSPSMKQKKHYNSFHPKTGFFLDIDKVLSWFDAEPSYFASVGVSFSSSEDLFLFGGEPYYTRSVTDVKTRCKNIRTNSEGRIGMLALWIRNEEYACTQSASSRGMG